MEEKKKLIRPRIGRMLAGICAGIANFFGVSATLVRIVYVLVTFFTGGIFGVLLYFILTFFISEEPNRFLKNE